MRAVGLRGKGEKDSGMADRIVSWIFEYSGMLGTPGGLKREDLGYHLDMLGISNSIRWTTKHNHSRS